MFTVAIFTALIAAVTAAPQPISARGVTKGTYKSYHGDGSTKAGWPAMTAWTSFDSMWNDNLSMMQNSCAQFSVSNTTPAEANEIKSAIQSVSASTKVDERFILAVILQESKGCVRVWETVSPDGTVVNPGLMQDHDGSHNCNSGSSTKKGSVQTPCPAAQITGMIQDGAGGTSKGDGLRQTLNKSGGNDAQTVYRAARLYNSGSFATNGDLVSGGATTPYCSDIANRLMGVVFDNSPFA